MIIIMLLYNCTTAHYGNRKSIIGHVLCVATPDSEEPG